MVMMIPFLKMTKRLQMYSLFVEYHYHSLIFFLKINDSHNDVMSACKWGLERETYMSKFLTANLVRSRFSEILCHVLQ